MSKQSRKKARKARHRRRQLSTVICQSCGTAQDSSPEALMGNLAAMLTACRDSGLRIRVRHSVIIAEAKRSGGYLLEFPGGWRACYQNFAPVPARDPADMDDD